MFQGSSYRRRGTVLFARVNILQVSNHDLRGGRFGGYALRASFDPHRHRVEMAVGIRESDCPEVHELGFPRPGVKWMADQISRRMSHWLSLDGLPALQGLSLFDLPCFHRADLVHLQLLHAQPFFSLASLPRLTRQKPTVWTIHDPWAMTGLCVHPEECLKWRSGCRGRCPHPRGGSPIRDRMAGPLWSAKRAIYARSDLSLVAPSRFIEERLRSSPLLGRFPIVRIPYGIDLATFAVNPTTRREARRRMSIDPDDRVIAFRALPLATDAYKGCAWLRQALELYQPTQKTWLITLQEGKDFKDLEGRYRVLDPGWLDGHALVEAYAAADIFLMPSTQEAFGLMAVEAMACGVPVITFEGTAIPEVIEAPLGGVAVPMKDSGALAAAIHRLLSNPGLRLTLGRQARELAAREYGLSLSVERHLRLYEEVRARFTERAGSRRRPGTSLPPAGR